jgi:hypothetical protein
MAEMDDALAEVRHHIIGSLKPARPQHQETSGNAPAMTQPVNIEHHGSAAAALRRLAHPGRDGSAVVEEPVSESINPERTHRVIVDDDPIAPLIRRLSVDMPELMEEVLAFIERRTTELNGAAPRPTESVAPAALVQAAPAPQDDDTGIATINLRFDTQVLARIDADAKRLGISRTTWLHVAASEALE